MMSTGQGFSSPFKGLLLAIVGGAAAATSLMAQPLPAGDHPGCYAKTASAPVYNTVTEQVAGAPVVRYRNLPAVIEHSTRQVLVRPARVEHKIFAPVYRTTSRWVEIAGPMRHIHTAAVFRTLTARRLISPAHLEWRAGAAPGFVQSRRGYGQSGDGVLARPTGEVMCRVRVPARYSTVRRRVMVSSSRDIAVQAPPRRMRVSAHVLVQPGRTVDRQIPAIYRTFYATRVTKPASRERIVTPGPMRTVSHRVLAQPAHSGWTPVCKIPPVRHPVVRHYSAPMRVMPAPPPIPAPAPVFVQRAPTCGCSQPGGAYYAPTPVQAPPQQYFAPSAGPTRAPYNPDERVAPASTYPAQTYPATPAPASPYAPYDVGHPARP